MTDVVDIVTTEYLAVEETITSTVDVENEQTVAVSEETLTLVSEGLQGPEGVAGPKGDKGEPGGTLIEYLAAKALSGHRVVMVDGDGRATYASNTETTHLHRIVGITTHAAEQNAVVAISIYGELVEPTWNWAADQPVFLGADGHLTQVAPAADAARFSIVVGFPISPTKLFVNIGTPIILRKE